jgi:hypothetical protein
VCDEEGLFGFDDDDSFSALRCVSVVLFPRFARLVREVLLTFFPYRLVSSALMTMYFWPAMCSPVDWTFLGVELSLYAPTISCSSAGVTLKAGDVAHTEVPSALKMAALSTWVVPMRLWSTYAIQVSR